ncbi:DUF3419 family protein [Aerosakkonema sp. BLCC-F183]|uniref:DUF3419 family protein n=1 Tax=Aerosakkonema sp. BLCC-F183 TaxID=3342834 RepID=UPI0035B7220D
MPSEIALAANFSEIRYAQCWEDADILLSALDIQADSVCLSIASGGDNTLAMLSRRPKRVIAVDLSPAQIACLELRVAAYRELTHPELLVLMGSRNELEEAEDYIPFSTTHHPQISQLRIELYRRCRSHLSPNVGEFWDDRLSAIASGIGASGKFERYLAMFRRYILPLIHNRDDIVNLLKLDTPEQRHIFYENRWNNWRWQLLFRVFFSQFVLGRLGTDPSFLKYANISLAEHLLARTRHALITLNPAENPYLHWMIFGQHFHVLPYALRPENFDSIRTNLDRLEWRCTAIEDFLGNGDKDVIDRFNLSNIFEFMSLDNYHHLLRQIMRVGRRKGRLVYWNRLVERRRPESMADCLRSLSSLADELYQKDKVFFYRNLIVEEII